MPKNNRAALEVISLFIVPDLVYDQHVIGVVGGSAQLPCNITAPSPANPTILVMWFKNNYGDPIYR